MNFILQDDTETPFAVMVKGVRFYDGFTIHSGSILTVKEVGIIYHENSEGELAGELAAVFHESNGHPVPFKYFVPIIFSKN